MKIKTSHALTAECKRLLKILAEKLGVNQTSVIEMSVREKALKENVK